MEGIRNGLRHGDLTKIDVGITFTKITDLIGTNAFDPLIKTIDDSCITP